jgi:hypothetical protein
VRGTSGEGSYRVRSAASCAIDPALRALERHGDYDVTDTWPSVWIVEASPTGTNTSADLLTEAEHELERHRRSGH